MGLVEDFYNACKKYFINCKAPIAVFVIGMIKANKTFFKRSGKKIIRTSWTGSVLGKILRCPS